MQFPCSWFLQDFTESLFFIKCKDWNKKNQKKIIRKNRIYLLLFPFFWILENLIVKSETWVKLFRSNFSLSILLSIFFFEFQVFRNSQKLCAAFNIITLNFSLIQQKSFVLLLSYLEKNSWMKRFFQRKIYKFWLMISDKFGTIEK